MNAELFSSKGGVAGVSRLATSALSALRKPSVLRWRRFRRSSWSAPILRRMA